MKRFFLAILSCVSLYSTSYASETELILQSRLRDAKHARLAGSMAAGFGVWEGDTTCTPSHVPALNDNRFNDRFKVWPEKLSYHDCLKNITPGTCLFEGIKQWYMGAYTQCSPGVSAELLQLNVQHFFGIYNGAISDSLVDASIRKYKRDTYIQGLKDTVDGVKKIPEETQGLLLTLADSLKDCLKVVAYTDPAAQQQVKICYSSFRQGFDALVTQ